MCKWIKCSEQMPGDFEDVLVTDGVNVEVIWRIVKFNMRSGRSIILQATSNQGGLVIS